MELACPFYCASFGAGVVRFVSGRKRAMYDAENAGHPVPRLTPSTPSISIIRWAAVTTCLFKATHPKINPFVERQPTTPSQAAAACPRVLRSNPGESSGCSLPWRSIATRAACLDQDATCRRPISACSLSRHCGRAADVMQPCNAMPARSGTAAEPQDWPVSSRPHLMERLGKRMLGALEAGPSRYEPKPLRIRTRGGPFWRTGIALIYLSI